MILPLGLIFLSSLCGMSHASASPQFEVFPTLEGETLSGKDVSLPQVFHEKSVWIMIGFTKDSQKSTSLCAEKLDAVFPDQGYSIAIIQGAPFFIKGVIKNSIRSSVPERRRDQYFVLSEGRDELQRLAGYEEKLKNDAYFLGLRSKTPSESIVLFKNHGTCDSGHLSIVTKSIQKLNELK